MPQREAVLRAGSNGQRAGSRRAGPRWQPPGAARARGSRTPSTGQPQRAAPGRPLPAAGDRHRAAPQRHNSPAALPCRGNGTPAPTASVPPGRLSPGRAGRCGPARSPTEAPPRGPGPPAAAVAAAPATPGTAPFTARPSGRTSGPPPTTNRRPPLPVPPRGAGGAAAAATHSSGRALTRRGRPGSVTARGWAAGS